MMNCTTAKDIKEKVIAKSKQDSINSVEFNIIKKSLLPEGLYEILKNNVRPFPNMSEEAKNYYHVVSGLATFHNQTEDIYWYINKLLLYLEHYQCIMNMKEFNLYNQTITPSKNREKEFIIRVPGLSEDRQSLRERDSLEIYQVGDGNNCTMGKIAFVGNDYISVNVTEEFRKRFQSNQRFNIEFQYFDWEIKNFNFVLDKIYNQPLASMLYPVKQTALNIKSERQIEWISNNIKHNREQQQAVINILNKTSKPAPYILFGPPGTGKTSTLIEAICQIIKENSSNRVLICTPSNAAADEISIRLSKLLIDDDNNNNNNTMYRMYAASKNVNDVHDNLKSISNFADAQIVYIDRNVFLRKRIVITTLSTCIRLYKYKLRENHFSHLFCDEAGQATELETLVPLVLMSGDDSNNLKEFCGQIVLAGDPKQLGPVVLSRLAEPLLGKSMLERLMNWKLYKKMEKTNKYDPMYVTKLIRNYRSHPAILYLPNKLFYDGDLIAKAGDNAKRAENWSGLKNKKFPILFHAVKSNEKRETNSPSVCNHREVDAVVKYVKNLLNIKLGGKIITNCDIGIVTPYKLQKNKIQKELEKNKINDVSVGTVEIFQGQERDIIIISSVRTKLYKHNNQIHIGFLSHEKRFNVAITRARALLIVVGDPRILEHDKCWRALIQYCIDNKSCVGDKFTLNKHMKKSEIRKLVAKKHTIEMPNNNTDVNQEPVVELPNSPCDHEENDNVNRRRRLPIGPLPKEFNYYHDTWDNSQNNSTADSHYEFYRKLVENYHDYSDENNESEHEDSNTEVMSDDDDDENVHFVSSENSPSSSSDYLSSASVIVTDITDSIEVELRERMAKLVMK